jgi:hypothetical protein
MQCEEVREQITDYVTGGLDKPRQKMNAEIGMHLDTCESCRAEFADAEELSAVWNAMGAVPAPPPGRDARARFDLMADAYQQGLDQATTPGFSGWWSRLPALQFGLALALLALGVLVGQQWRPAPVVTTGNDEIAELRGQVNAMNRLVALSLMQNQSSAGDRLRGVNWSYQLQKPGDEVLGALLDTLMHDPNVNVRLATVDALRQFGDQTVVRRGVVEAMKKQESPMVQVALIDLAVDLKDRESIGTLQEFTRNEKLDVAVRERAQKGLAELE